MKLISLILIITAVLILGMFLAKFPAKTENSPPNMADKVRKISKRDAAIQRFFNSGDWENLHEYIKEKAHKGYDCIEEPGERYGEPKEVIFSQYFNSWSWDMIEEALRENGFSASKGHNEEYEICW